MASAQLRLFIPLLLVFIHLFGTASAREWVDTTGKYRIQAELVEVKDGNVKLKTTEGREVVVPLAKLSQADQDFIAEQQKSKDDAALTADEKQARVLVDEALALLRLDPRTNAQLIDSKLRKASELNPRSVDAEFLRGVYHLLVTADPAKAARSFELCLRREPKNVAILNNAGLSRLKSRGFTAAYDHFKKAAKIDPKSPAVCQNLARALLVHSDKRLQLTGSMARRLGDLYAGMAAGEDGPEVDGELGWAVTMIRQTPDQPPVKSDLPAEIDSGGTGFVVKGDYIITNRHVVKGAVEIKVRVPGDSKRTLPAKLIAISNDADVAVLQCEGLEMPSIGIAASIPRRGSDVMILGFPQFWQLGATIKSTRGAVTSLPAEETDNMLLVDAEMNSGNSGGPIANKSGKVVAIATAVYKPTGGTGGRYGAGLPIASHLEFLKKHIPELAAEDGGEDLAWPDVDDKVSKSTVLVLVAGTNLPQMKPIGGHKVILDPTCPHCSGSKVTKYRRLEIPCPHCEGLGVDSKAAVGILRRRELERRYPPRPDSPGSSLSP